MLAHTYAYNYSTGISRRNQPVTATETSVAPLTITTSTTPTKSRLTHPHSTAFTFTVVLGPNVRCKHEQTDQKKNNEQKKQRTHKTGRPKQRPLCPKRASSRHRLARSPVHVDKFMHVHAVFVRVVCVPLGPLGRVAFAVAAVRRAGQRHDVHQPLRVRVFFVVGLCTLCWPATTDALAASLRGATGPSVTSLFYIRKRMRVRDWVQKKTSKSV